MTETWSYYDANTIEITGDLTTKYWVGQLIKITQTTDKFFAITAVNLVTGNTRLTINGGGVYTLVNAAITSHEFSNYASPKGVPLNFNKNINGNFAASTDPTAGDDSADGYVVGSPWVNTTDHKIFLCESPAAGAAVWRQIWPARAADMNFQAGIYQQLLINGGFQVNQHAVTTYTAATVPDNGDDHYLHDQWILLSDGNDIVDVSAETTIVPSGAAASVKFEVETQNKKFGYLQIIENKDAIKYAGQVASLQFKARTTTAKVIENVRAAVLSWSSTADTVTSDVVSAWGNEGDNPTFATNWTAENTAANNALVADTWTTYKIENISIDTASMANLAVFIWVDDTDAAVDDLLYLADVQLNAGAVCLPFMPHRYSDDSRRCQRFFRAYGSGSNFQCVANGKCISTTVAYLYLPFEEPMRVTPSLTYSDLNHWCVQRADANNETLSALSVEPGGSSTTGVNLLATVGGNLVAGDATVCTAISTLDARMWFDSRL